MNVESMNATQIHKKIEELDNWLKKPENYNNPQWAEINRDRRQLVTRQRELDRSGLFELNI